MLIKIKKCFSLFLYCLSFGITLAQSSKPILQTTIQSGHYGPVKSLEYTPDGRFIASGSRDKSVRLWEVATGRELKVFSGHQYTVRALAFSPDGKTLATGGNDKRLLLWDLNSGSLLRSFEGHTSRVTSLAFSPDGSYLLSGGHDREAYLWAVDSAKIVRRFPVNPARGTGEGISVTFSPNGKYLALGQDNYTTEVWNVSNGEKIGSFRNNDRGNCSGCPSLAAFGTASGKLYTASSQKGFFKWDLLSGEKEKTYEAPENKNKYWFLEYHADRGILLTGDDKSVKIIDEASARLKLRISTDSITCSIATLSPDGKQIAVGTDSGTILFYDAITGKHQNTLQGLIQNEADQGYEYDVNSYWDHFIAEYYKLKSRFTISPDGNYLLMGKIGKKARMIDLSTGRTAQEFIGHEKAVTCHDFSPDGKWLLTGSADKNIILWEVATGKAIRTYKGHVSMIFDIKFDTRAERFLSGSWDGTARLWDIATGEQLSHYDMPGASPYTLSFVRDDLYFLTATLDNKVQLYEIDSKAKVKEYHGSSNKVHDLDLHKEEKHFLTAGWDGSVRQWSLATGLMDFKIPSSITGQKGHDDRVYTALYAPQGNLIATGSADRSIKLWDRNDQSLVATLLGHNSAVTSLAFTPDGETLISGSIDGEIRIWDIQGQKLLMTYYSIGEEDWLVTTPEGLFDATPQAQEFIFFVQGLESYSIDQFFEDFYHPNLMRSIFAGGDLLQEGKSIQGQLKSFPPPSIQVLSPERENKVMEGEMDFLVKFTDQGGGIDEIKVMHNGKRLSIDQKGLKRNPKKGNRITKAFQAILLPGPNEIRISAYSKGRIESRQTVLNLPVKGRAKKGTAYVLAVGIDKYQNPKMNLNYAKADAQAFVKSLKAEGAALFENIEVRELYNEKASKTAIIGNLNYIALRAIPEDLFVFYYAGHGSMAGQDFYFVPHESTRLYEENKMKKEGLHTVDIMEICKKIKALKQVMMIDACHSGASVGTLARRGGVEEKAIAHLSRSAGIHVLASAGSGQFATEFKALGHGVFTYALIEAMQGKADGSPSDGKVTIFEVKSFLDNSVPELSQRHKGEPQYPYTFSIGNDFPITLPKDTTSPER